MSGERRTSRAALLLFAGLGLALSACGGGPGSGLESADYEYRCFRDEECAEGLVCFPDGCADPGENIVVEITPAAAKGIHAQDVKFDRVASALDFRVDQASGFLGALSLGSDAGATAYTSGVSVRCTGESHLIPGQLRRFETAATQTGGSYVLPTASGRYTLVATPVDLSIPPVVAGPETVAAGQTRVLNLIFPGASEILTYQGKLVRTATPTEEPLPGNVTMEISAVHPTTGQPLSQRIETGGDGHFTLAIAPEAQRLSSFQVRVSPKTMNLSSGQAFVPTKVFNVSPTQLSPVLELGAYPSPISVTGTLVSHEGVPVAGASVSVEGSVTGGGTFRSASVTSNADGVFQLTTLPSAPDKTLALVAAPPSTSEFGILHFEVAAPAGGPITLGLLPVPRKAPVLGRVVTFEGYPASSVRVRAVPLEPATPGGVLPQGDEATTGAAGTFELALDPAALYRLDYVPIFGNSPRASRFFTLQRGPGAESRSHPEELPELVLSRGRKVAGVVRSVQVRDSDNVTEAPYAQVRFFREVGKASSLLIGEATTDASGRYELLLPSR